MRNNYIEILNNKIEIPIIQRDYAQGRTNGKVDKIRKDLEKYKEKAEDLKQNAEDRKKEIVFGLREKDKPPTLISPRPKIRVKRFRTINEKQIEVIENQDFDDSMNIVLSKIDFEDIFKAMYDNSICFDFDLTQISAKAEL